MGVAKDVSSAAMPYVILGGVIIAAWMFRDKIKNWIVGGVTSAVIDPVSQTYNDIMPAVVTEDNPYTPTGAGSTPDTLLNIFGGLIGVGKSIADKLTGGSTGIDTSIPGTTPGVLSDASGNVQTLVIPAGDVGSWVNPVVSREPITTPGYESALQGVSNLVTGSAAEAYANAQAIRAAAAAPPSSGWNFQTIKPLIEPDGYTEFNLSPTLALGINKYGWDVHYTQNSGPWHEGQIISMTSGGDNPFGGGAFDAYLKQAMAYGGV